MKFIKILSLLFAALFVFVFTSGAKCQPQTTVTEDTFNYVRDSSLEDFATKVTLNANNIEQDFDKTGRGLVTVDVFIDGDTVHFWNYSKTKRIKVRFLAIDTPESTGRIEPWGKPASIYTKSKLENAEKICLESDVEGEAPFDSTGERHLAWVWYLPKGSNVWRNLNIEILSDGLAMGKSSSNNRYGDVAMTALSDARANKINMYSGNKAPLFYYGETVDLTIKALITNTSAYNGQKVRFEGVISKEEGQGVYVESFDEDTNRSYAVYVYGGFDSLASRFLKKGYRLRITGNATDSEEFGFQVSGLSFSLINPRDTDVQILEKDVKITPTVISGAELNENYLLTDLFVQMNNLVVKSVYTTKDITSKSYGAMTLTCTSEDGETVKVRTNVLTFEDGTPVTDEYFMGKTISVVGVVDDYNNASQLKLISILDVLSIK